MVWLQRQRGFTLIEMVMVITILGVVASMVAVFMKSPIDAYFASSRRAALTDVADTTVRRMARDIHKALPNSLRTPGSSCVEFITTKTGGRYRADGAAAALAIGVSDTSFNMLGGNSAPVPPSQRISLGDTVVVYNLGIPGADAYSSTNLNRSTVSATPTESLSPPETSIPIASATFALGSGSNRFHVVPANEPVVGYVCSGVGTSAAGQGTGVLSRYVATLPYAAPTSCPAAAVGGNIIGVSTLATRVSACSFDYSGSDLQRNALVRMAIAVTDSSETVSLYHEVHVNNTP